MNKNLINAEVVQLVEAIIEIGSIENLLWASEKLAEIAKKRNNLKHE